MLPAPDRIPTDMTTALGDDGRARCAWARGDLARYHDEEWGVPLHGDAALFEKLSLEGFQSGLSWLVVLRKRDAFREAFAGFEPERVAAFGEADVERLLGDARLIRNRRKIEAVLANAGAVAGLRERDGDGALDRLVWRHRPEPRPEAERPAAPGDVPASTAASKELAAALKREGLVFVGPVTVYALMQSAGLVDDHLMGRWRAGVSG